MAKDGVVEVVEDTDVVEAVVPHLVDRAESSN